MEIELIFANEELKRSWTTYSQWPEEIVLKHMHLENGFTIIARIDNKPAGMVSVYWKEIDNYFPQIVEGYIDIIEVHRDYRRKGIARKMIEKVIEHAKQVGVYQIRAWSSEDKVEAIQMWRALDFALCPATTYPNGKTINGIYAVKKL